MGFYANQIHIFIILYTSIQFLPSVVLTSLRGIKL